MLQPRSLDIVEPRRLRWHILAVGCNRVRLSDNISLFLHQNSGTIDGCLRETSQQQCPSGSPGNVGLHTATIAANERSEVMNGQGQAVLVHPHQKTHGEARCNRNL